MVPPMTNCSKTQRKSIMRPCACGIVARHIQLSVCTVGLDLICDSCPGMHRRFSCQFPELNDGYVFPDAKVDGITAGKTALEFLSCQFSGGVQEWQQRLANGQVVLKGGMVVQAGTVLRAGDCLVYTRASWREPDTPNYFDVLYEDDQVLAVCKPAGLQVLPGGGDFCQHTVMWLLQQYHQQHRSRLYPASLVPVPVHRLGRGTSGVLLCACTEAARKQLSRDFASATDAGAAAVACQASAAAGAAVPPGGQAEQQHPLGKQYRALVTGLLGQDEGEVCVPIGLVKYPGLPSGLFAASQTGKPALSRYKVLARHTDQDSTLVEVTILTGRPHQIRIHMAALGHPLVGDPLYGPGGVPKVSLNNGDADADCVMPGDCGYHLHSMQLQFRHPGTGDSVTVQAPVPEQLRTPQELEAAAP